MGTSSHPSSIRSRNSISTLRVLQNVFSIAILLATLFTAISPRVFTGNYLSSVLAPFLSPQQAVNAPIPTTEFSVRIGIVSGHWGHDSGAVCDNGTTEQQVNLMIATLVQQKLSGLGYQVDLLQEFDTRLVDYRAVALVSIHNDSCQYINDQATGFKVASALASRDPNLSLRLVSCIRDRYEHITGLPFHPNSITPDMTQYHAFQEIDPATTAAIIETGFLYKDYDILTKNPELIADGIVAGLVCFVNNENIAPEPTITP